MYKAVVRLESGGETVLMMEVSTRHRKAQPFFHRVKCSPEIGMEGIGHLMSIDPTPPVPDLLRPRPKKDSP
jgi:hypothetical protein